MERCKGKATSVNKDGPGVFRSWEPLAADQPSRATRGTSIINYMAQGRPDLAVIARELPHCPRGWRHPRMAPSTASRGTSQTWGRTRGEW